MIYCPFCQCPAKPEPSPNQPSDGFVVMEGDEVADVVEAYRCTKYKKHFFWLGVPG